MRFELEQTYGLDSNGNFSTDFVPFAADSTEQFLMDVMARGDVEKLAERGLLICERPLKIMSPAAWLCSTQKLFFTTRWAGLAL